MEISIIKFKYFLSFIIIFVTLSHSAYSKTVTPDFNGIYIQTEKGELIELKKEFWHPIFITSINGDNRRTYRNCINYEKAEGNNLIIEIDKNEFKYLVARGDIVKQFAPVTNSSSKFTTKNLGYKIYCKKYIELKTRTEGEVSTYKANINRGLYLITTKNLNAYLVNFY